MSGEINVNEAGLERLRNSRKSKMDRDEAEGVEIGKRWALETAEFDELERVSKLEPFDGWDPAMELAAAIQGDDFLPRDASDVLQPIFDTESPSEWTVLGFIDGAGEVLNEV